MASKTYRYALDPANPFVQRGVTRFATVFREGGNTRDWRTVRDCYFDVAPGDTVTTEDMVAQDALERFTDDAGTVMFVEQATRVNDQDVDAEVFDRFRSERVR